MEAKNYLTADFLDILFEGKNKAYGAYLLRQEYDKRVARAVVVTFCLVFLLVGAIVLSKYVKAHNPVSRKVIPEILVLQQVNTKPDLPLPPPPPAPKPPKLKTQVKYTPPKVVENEQVRPEDEPPDLTKLKNVTISTIDKKGEIDGLEKFSLQESGNGITEAAPSADDSIFTFVEQKPTFPGGLGALMKYLNEHIRYPSVARENGIQGTVFVQFVVNTDGSIVDVKTVGQKRGGGLEEEAVHVVKGMPKWNPGKQNGRSVRVQFSLPVRFKLQ